MKPGDAAGLAKYVVQQAPKYHLDANAVVAVALQEGLSGKVGDNGTSFGPWQLHAGGAYPANAPDPSNPAAANAWAWSPAGIDYALRGMSKVAAGQQGRQAVHSIVYKFERPQDPAAEYKAAVQALPANDGGPQGGGGIIGLIDKGLPDALSMLPGGPVLQAGEKAVGGIGGVVSGAEAVGNFLGMLTSAAFWIRALEVAGGGIIVMVGIYLLAKQVGLTQGVQSAARTAALATPQGRELAAAGAVTGAAE